MNIRPYQLFILLGLLFTSTLYALERISLSSSQAQADGISYVANSSANGRYVVFDSSATNLVSGDSNGFRDVFLRDRTTGTTELISVHNNGAQANHISRAASISDDGRYVSFESFAPLVAGTKLGGYKIYRRDRQNGRTELVSSNSSNQPASGMSMRSSISADGRYVLFYSWGSNLIAGDNNKSVDVFLKDMQSGSVERISVSTTGVAGNGDSFEASMSPDTRYVTFTSMSTNLTGSTIPRQRHVYIRDRQTGTTTMVTRAANGALANQASFAPEISDDGRYVVYYSLVSNLVAGTSGSKTQILLFDKSTSTTRLISRPTARVSVEGNDTSYSATISGDGRYIAFTSYASNLVAGDNNGVADSFLLDRNSNELSIVSKSETGSLANGHASAASRVSRSGNSVIFVSYASNLIMGDSNNVPDIFAQDLIFNAPPLAHAGADQRLQCSGTTTAVTLDGRASSDADGDALSYTWSVGGGQHNGAVITVPMALGTHIATLSVNDQRGGVQSDSASIQIIDSVAPNLILAPDKLLEASSRAGSRYAINPDGSDLCGSISMTISPSLTTYPLGQTVVNVSASDASGNTSSASQRVRVEDTTPPVLTAPADVQREALAKQMAIDIGTATATDIFDVTLSNDAPASYGVGSTTVNWQATDSNGNSSADSQLVTLVDTTAPVFGVINAITQEATAIRTPLQLSAPLVTDIFSVNLSSNAPADFALGNTLVTWRAVDEHGNASTADQLVTIQDTTAPKLTLPSNLIIEASGALTPVAPGMASAEDIFPVSIQNDATASLALGQHSVTWTATDSSGNKSQAVQRITIQDTTAPVLEVVAEIVVEAEGELTSVTLPAVSSNDLFALNVTNDAPALFPLGSTLVTWVAVDVNGNQTQATQTVKVVDTTAPTAEIEQLRDSIWPPNNKMVKVAHISAISDLVDDDPQLSAVVEWEHASSSKHHQRTAIKKQARKTLKHGNHGRRGGGTSSNSSEQKLKHDKKRRDEARHSSRHDKKSDWKLVQKDDEWNLYVRASTDGRSQTRTYTINITMTDINGNQSLHTMLVNVKHKRQNKDKSRHQD